RGVRRNNQATRMRANRKRCSSLRDRDAFVPAHRQRPRRLAARPSRLLRVRKWFAWLVQTEEWAQPFPSFTRADVHDQQIIRTVAKVGADVREVCVVDKRKPFAAVVDDTVRADTGEFMKGLELGKIFPPLHQQS